MSRPTSALRRPTDGSDTEIFSRLLGKLPAEKRAMLEANWGAYVWKPWRFVRDVIEVNREGTCPSCPGGTCKIDPWQDEQLYVMSRHRKVAIAGGTGVGKETFASWTMLWFTLTRPFPKVGATSASQGQLSNALWMELKKWIDHSSILSVLLLWTERRVYVRGFGARWRMFQSVAATRAAGEAGKQAEGAAGVHEQHVLLVVSEASGVDDAQIDARTFTLTKADNRILLIGNPLLAEGRFYEASRSKKSERLGDSGWQFRAVPQSDSSHVDHQATEDMIRELGIDHPTVRAKVFAEFPDANAIGGAIPGARVDAMFANVEAPDDPMEEIQIGCDPADEGGDETTIYVRRGVRILGRTAVQYVESPVIIQLITRALFRWWRRPWNDPRADDWDPSDEELAEMKATSVLVVDCVGIGAPLVSTLRLLGFRVVGVNNGSRSRRPKRYYNLGAELWLEDAFEWIGRGYCAPDEKLRIQLTSRRVGFSGKEQQRALEAKPKMKSRGRGSPDRADGFVLSVARVRATGTGDWSAAIIGL